MSRNRASTNQLEELLWYMETHRTFAKGHITDLGYLGHDRFKQMWKDLADKLNNIGPSQKSVAAWMKTWRLLKNAAKKRKAQYTLQMNRTGNISPVDTLTDFDARITSIFGKYGTGLCVIEEIGTPRDPRNATESHEIFDEEIKKPIPLHIVEEELSHNLHSLRCQNEITKGMFGNVSNYFVDLLVEFFSKLERLRKLRDTKKIKSRSNQPQLKQMVEFMEKHTAFANDKLSDPHASASLWEELATNLNYLGDSKSVKGWTKAWNDLVKSVQQRQTSLNLGTRNTPVPALDFRVLAIAEQMNQTIPRKDVSPHASQKFDSYRGSLTENTAHSSNRSATLRDRSPLFSRSRSGGSAAGDSPRRAAGGSSNHYSRHTSSFAPHRSVHGSPHNSPTHSFTYSPHRTPVYSPSRSDHHSPIRTPHRDRVHSSSRSGYHSPSHASHRSSSHLPRRSSPRSSMPSPRRSSPCSSMPSPRRNLSHRVKSSAPGPNNMQSSSAKAKPHQVPVVDLTRRTTPAGSSKLKHSTAAKGGTATTSAVVESMDAYVLKMTDFAEQVVKCFENQNRILRSGLLALGKTLEETANKIVSNWMHNSKCETDYDTNASFNHMKTDDPIDADDNEDKYDLIDADDNEDKWEAEYLE